MVKVALNIGIFYVGWFGIIMSQATGHAQFSHFLVPVLVLLHLFFVADSPKIEFFVLPLIAVVGFATDALITQLGLLVFQQPAWPAPAWLFELWLIFATTINYSMKVILARPLLAALVGLLGAPLTYLSGEYWRIVHYHEPRAVGMLIHGLCWAGLMFVMLRAYHDLHECCKNRFLGNLHQQ